MASNVSRMQRGGSATADRLASRSERPGRGLSRQAMPGGGEVFSGDVASRALKSLGARAMTVDRSIIVADDFDPNKPEDQALFAHEQFHQEHSGGAGSNEHRDSEEVAARAVERMVLHRARAGGTESHEAHLAVPSTDAVGKGGSGSQSRQNQEADNAAQRGYATLASQGYDHQLIIDKLAHEVIQGMDHARDNQLERFADKKGFL